MADAITELQEGQALFYTFPNNGVLFQRVPKDIMDRVNKVVQKLIDDNFQNGIKANYKLTANIEKEFDLSVELVPYMLDYINELVQVHNQQSHPHHIGEVTGVVSRPRKFKFKDSCFQARSRYLRLTTSN